MAIFVLILVCSALGWLMFGPVGIALAVIGIGGLWLVAEILSGIWEFMKRTAVGANDK